MSELGPAHFPSYFQACHGHQPFPWQERLLEQVLARGWPSTLSLPTASGKTAIIDVAVFALACQAHLPASERRAPRRIALVVDRRIVVDAAFDRAKRIRRCLLEGLDPVTKQVGDALRAAGGEEPLSVAALRGGIYREKRWARTPTQPVVLCSTVDQVGSRLLHRGYGLSSSIWPIHAGLLGTDCLVVLDEAHCSTPFLETLDWIARYRRIAQAPLALPFAVVAMSATPRNTETPFRLDERDRGHAVLGRRLEASKPMQLVAATEKGDRGLVKVLADCLRKSLARGRTLLAVVNRVATARALYSALRAPKKDHTAPEVGLLTGRARPIDRDLLLSRWWPRLAAGRDRSVAAAERPFVLVATQCIEVGADIDSDVLVTECAPLDALRQRLGRLDRLGETAPAPATVVCRMDQAWDGTQQPPDDAIYASALGRTWHWLSRESATAPLDGGALALEQRVPRDPQELAQLNAPAPGAPVVFPAYCDLWVQTGPEPGASPSPAVFLHGPGRGEPEVQLVWRADLDPAAPETWAETVALCPPVAAEAMPLRLSMARRWLGSAEPDPDAADLEGQAADESDVQSGRPALRWRGPDGSAIAQTPRDVRPADLLVVPCAYGGCDEFGWDPDSAAPVLDRAMEARLAARAAPVLRLHPSLEQSWGPAADVLRGLATIRPEEMDVDAADLSVLVASALASVAGIDSPVRGIASALAADRKLRIELHPSGTGLVLVGRAGWAEGGLDFTDEDETSSTAPRSLGLHAHLGDVERQARSFADALGLAPGLSGDLALAGLFHDLGKADPRFQAWLCGGDRLRAVRLGLQAKSDRRSTSPGHLERDRRRAGYPQGGRHELLSLRLVESAPALLARATDPDLVLHLVASHHGRCRPFAPVVLDERPVQVTVSLEGHDLLAASDTALERLDSGVADRFWRLVRRYGWWGLSYLEACLRLADHRASEAAAEGGTE